MTPLQKHSIRLSEIRSRLNAIAELEGDAVTDDIRNEAEGLRVELSTTETQYRAALAAEGIEQGALAGEFGNGDGEPAEVRALLGRVSIGDYLNAAAARNAIAGAPAELAAALEVPTVGASGGVAIPWAILALPERRAAPERRAYTTTAQNDGPEMQRPILERLFGTGVMEALGVRMDSVPVGRVEWPLISGGVAPAQTKEGTAAAAAVAATFSYANLTPKRITGRYEFSHEVAATTPGLEAALRRDLGDAVRSQMEQVILTGTAPNSTNPHRIEGFITNLTGADLATGVATAADYGRLHSLAVDGIHASRETEVMSVIGDETYQHAAGLYITGSGESGSELLMRRSGGCMASTYLPDAAGNKQPAILHASGPNGGSMRGDSVAAIWPSLEIIRDIYSQASQGVVLTWVGLWDAKVAFRASAYKQIDIQISS